MKKLIFVIGLVIFLYSVYEVEVLNKFRELTIIPYNAVWKLSLATNHWGVLLGAAMIIWVIQYEISKKDGDPPQALDDEIR